MKNDQHTEVETATELYMVIAQLKSEADAIMVRLKEVEEKVKNLP